MKTIEKILDEAWYTKDYLLEQRRIGRTNGMWGKWGIQWTDKLRKLEAFNSKKEQALLNDLDLVSDIHDIDFEYWGFIIAFIKANYRLILRILMLLRWTTITWRLIISLLAFFWLNIFWIRYFNWTFNR